MKKKLLSGLFALALLATTAVGLAESKKSEAAMSDLAMANVEALAYNEVDHPCPNGCYDNGTGCFCHVYYPYYREAGSR